MSTTLQFVETCEPDKGTGWGRSVLLFLRVHLSRNYFNNDDLKMEEDPNICVRVAGTPEFRPIRVDYRNGRGHEQLTDDT